MSNRFCELLGCELPVQGAPMGGVASTPDLPAAVASAGGFGMFAATVLPAEALDPPLQRLSRIAPGPFGVNFLAYQGFDREAVEVAAAMASLVDFFWAEPEAAAVGWVHEAGALCGWQCGTVEEARAAAAAGCDLVIAQGVEAGGHVRGTTAMRELVAATAAAVGVPVVAAGGIVTAPDAAAAREAGADAVRIGTALLAAEEADVHPDYARAVIEAGPGDTVLTKAFHVMWEDAAHRVLRSSLEAAEAFEGEIVAEVELTGNPLPVPRFATIPPIRSARGAVAAMPHFAGAAVGSVEQVRPAAEIVSEVAGGLTSGSLPG